MDSGRRRFSTAQQLNPDTLKVIDKKKDRRKSLGTIEDVEDGHPDGEPRRKESLPQKFTTTIGNLALFKDEDDVTVGNGTSAFAGYITPGPKERATSNKKKVQPLTIQLA